MTADVGNFKNLNKKWDDDDVVVDARFSALESYTGFIPGFSNSLANQLASTGSVSSGL